MVQNSLCEKLVLSHMPDQSVQYEMKKHSAAHLILLSLQSLQDEMVPLFLQSIHVKTMRCLFPIQQVPPNHGRLVFGTPLAKETDFDPSLESTHGLGAESSQQGVVSQ